GAGYQPAAVYGERGRGEVERVPLVSRGDTVGRLVVESRAAGESLRSDELRLLADLARQAATAVDAARLTNDLQRSRERLVVAREEERRRLRRDLHDGLGPTLAAVVLQLDNARALVREDPEVTSAMLAALRDAAQEAIGDVRQLVYGLRPPALDELGLVPAIREQAARMNGDERGVQIRVEGPDELTELPAAVEVAAFRIAVEAITNVVRHADANTCVVQLALNGNLEVDVHDDGTARDGYPAGVGISSMRERATELGGSFTITPARQRGTRVHVTLPLSDS
ncbi:MAG: sensor histidine kinase, partial [Actinomycetota bacterium]|nr:sensor histidine kinase [Actinomycetota bacterium]